ncbi:MAG: hypothetical protein U5L01_12760 [Rheinheimera sp.]|nr:hypothetical protein [Rheinheimera sp.]
MTSFSQREVATSYDVIFLNDETNERMNGAEIVEHLIAMGILPNRTRLVATFSQQLKRAIRN